MSGFDTPKEAPKSPSDVLKDFMPPKAEELGNKAGKVETKFEAETLKGPKGYNEIKKPNGEQQAILKKGAAEIKRNSKGEKIHGGTFTIEGKDKYEYIILADETKKPPYRLFKSPKKREDSAEEMDNEIQEAVSDYLKNGQEVNPTANKDAKFVLSQLKNNVGGKHGDSFVSDVYNGYNWLLIRDKKKGSIRVFKGRER